MKGDDGMQWVGMAHGGGYTMTLQVATGGHEQAVREAVSGAERGEGKETSAILMRRQRTRELTSPIVTAKSDEDNTTPTHRSQQQQKWSLDIAPSPSPTGPQSASALNSLLSSTFPAAHPTTFSPPALDPRRSSLPSSLSSSSRRHSIAFLQSQLLNLYFVHHIESTKLTSAQLLRFQQERCPVCLTAELQLADEGLQVTVLTCKDQQCEHVLHTLCLSSPLASALIIAHPVGAEVAQPIELRKYAPNLLGATGGRGGAARMSKRMDCVYELTVVHWMVDVVAVKLSSLSPAGAAISTHRTVSAVYNKQTGTDVITLYNAATNTSASSTSSASFSASAPVTQASLPFVPFSHGRLIFSCQCHATKEEWQLHAELDLRPVQAPDGRRRDEYELVYRYEKGAGGGGEGELHVVVSEGALSGRGDKLEQGWFIQSVRFEVSADSVVPFDDTKAAASRLPEPLPPPPTALKPPGDGRRPSRTPDPPHATLSAAATAANLSTSGTSNAAAGSAFSPAAAATYDAARYSSSSSPSSSAASTSYQQQQQQQQQQQPQQQHQPQVSSSSPIPHSVVVRCSGAAAGAELLDDAQRSNAVLHRRHSRCISRRIRNNHSHHSHPSTCSLHRTLSPHPYSLAPLEPSISTSHLALVPIAATASRRPPPALPTSSPRCRLCVHIYCRQVPYRQCR